MSRKLPVVVVVALVALSQGLARAETCSIDPVPGATLLLPYFEVDIGDGDSNGTADGLGVNTVFTVYHSASQILAATPGIVLADACQNADPRFGSAAKPDFSDGFESGTTSEWSYATQ